jgi:hypothetical protein
MGGRAGREREKERERRGERMGETGFFDGSTRGRFGRATPGFGRFHLETHPPGDR